MSVRFVASAVTFAAAVTLCLGGTTATVEAQEATRAPRNLEEFDAMFRELSNWGRWALAKTSARENRWEFLLTTGPIPVTGGTSSPLNPIAVF